MKPTAGTKTRRVCSNGHTYYKSSDCPVCPICERQRQTEADFLKVLGAPARRALEAAGITSLERLSRTTEAELLALHGFGPSSLPKLRKILEEAGLNLKK